MKYKQGNPYCIQIELTEGCNLRCPFCGLNGIRGKDNNFKFMTVETAANIISSMVRNKWNSRVEFAMHGEPTMNPEGVEIIRMFHEHLPKAYILMESNGGGLVARPYEKVTALFDAGLTTLALDEYQQVKLVDKIWRKLAIEEAHTWQGIEVHDYPSCGSVGNPHKRNKNKRLIRIRPIDLSTSGTHASLNNHGGSGAPSNQRAQGKRCAKPFREISVRWDGGVAICCNDWRGTVPIGNVNEEDLHKDIWHSPVMYAARRKLYAGERDFGACDGCDALSYRPGILPDHKGQVELDPPTKQDEAVLAEAITKGPMTKPVLRLWEK